MAERSSYADVMGGHAAAEQAALVALPGPGPSG